MAINTLVRSTPAVDHFEKQFISKEFDFREMY